MSEILWVPLDILGQLILYLVFTLVPNVFILGWLYMKYFRKLKRIKTVNFINALIATVLAPFNAYGIGYLPTDGWKNGTGQYLVYIVLRSPATLIISYVLFVILSKILIRRNKAKLEN
jgi:uncharacterized membrane protein